MVRHDAPHFPDADAIRDRRDSIEAGNELSLRAFEEAVAGAEVHVFVLDHHFDKRGADILGGGLVLSQVRDVRLLTGRGSLADADRRDLANVLTESCNEERRDGRHVAVRWRATLSTDSFPFLHDRFAIVDGALWHFGATVGGGYPRLTAVSGPWSATETRAIDFFEECWRRNDA
ncbi:MAG: hypothetical protein OXH96_14115 [Spirochaetaceae bacterium]|nr:hypothetical protein [Spirochaetaceae bacterium]